VLPELGFHLAQSDIGAAVLVGAAVYKQNLHVIFLLSFNSLYPAGTYALRFFILLSSGSRFNVPNVKKTERRLASPLFFAGKITGVFR
jgi:hypothetical protein